MNRIGRYAAVLTLLGSLLTAVPAARADVPGYLPIQGYLSDAEGKPIDGAVAIRFRIYNTDAPSGDSAEILFEEHVPVVRVSEGFFTTYLGDHETLDLSIFRKEPIAFVGMLISGDTEELQPLLQLATAPYAAHASHAKQCDDAATLEGKKASDFLPSNYAPDWSAIRGAPANLLDGDDDTGILSIASGGWLTASVAGRAATLNHNIASCPAGQSIRAIAANGTVTCEVDDVGAAADTNTTYSAAASGGLSLSGTQFGLSSSCTNGQVLKSNGAGAWSCASDANTLGGLACSAGQVAQWTGSAWACRNIPVSNYSDGSVSRTLTTSMQTIHSATITIPGAGRVLAWATVDSNFQNGSSNNDHALVANRLCKSATESDSNCTNLQWVHHSWSRSTGCTNANECYESQRLALMGSFSFTAAGRQTIYLLGRTMLAGDSVLQKGAQIMLQYVPALTP